VSVFNENKVIQDKLDNFLKLNYPHSNIELLIGSDGSSDTTDNIIHSYTTKHDNIKLFSFPVRQGKASILNHLVKEATGDILIFSDANTIFAQDTIQNIIAPFSTKIIGCVCGKLHLITANQINTGDNCESMYWRFETALKTSEGRLGLLIGANGGLYAIRKSLYENLPIELIITDDLLVPMRILQNKHKVIFAANATATEFTANDLNTELKRKTRIMAGNWNTIKYILPSLYQYPHAFNYWSHKVIRWLTPFFLVAILALNILLARQPLFLLILIAHVLLYVFSFTGYFLEINKRSFALFTYPYYFISVNIAIILGLIKSIFNRQKPFWNK
jgi:cellulose synthase/poly-beta-1,6-N-acetylglucosamine synthase-like glycosyltransferase